MLEGIDERVYVSTYRVESLSSVSLIESTTACPHDELTFVMLDSPFCSLAVLFSISQHVKTNT